MNQAWQDISSFITSSVLGHVYGMDKSCLQAMKGCLQHWWAGPRLIPCLLKSHDCV